jgi:hypothetical protein
VNIHNTDNSFEITEGGKHERKCPTNAESVQKQKREKGTIKSLNS